MPVGGLCKFLVDDVTDQQDLTAAQQGADDEGGQRRDKDHGNTADDTGHWEGQYNTEKSMYVVCAQIPGGVDHILVNLGQCIV